MSILILPGINDSGAMHWQSIWERTMVAARRVQAADWNHPVCADWVANLDSAVVQSGDGTILVAHSLGCLQVAHWAAKAAPQNGRLVRAALLVAPPDPDRRDFPATAAGFSPLPRQRLPFASILVASSNDPYAAPTFAASCAAAWGSRLVDVGPCGHINAESGLGDWSFGRQLLAELTGS
jgi:predicted alpha/beta hydrolase family esterase